MEDLSLHVLDIAENAVRAEAKRIEIVVDEDLDNNMLAVEIVDDGRGMDGETLKRAMDPFFTTKKAKRVGLGLSLLAQAASQSGGRMEVGSQPGRGTKIRATFEYDHPDRKPLGDMTQTLTTLIVGNPDVDVVYEHRVRAGGKRWD